MIQKNRKQGLDWLKLRSLHIKGLPADDIGGVIVISIFISISILFILFKLN